VVAIQQNAPASTSTDAPPARAARIFLIGSGTFGSNLAVNTPAGNQDLILNAANWLVDQGELVSIRPRTAETRSMLLTGVQLNLIKFSSWLFLPLAVLATGAAVWWTRR
jgi:ABC-type uncharacterized transport system involved in gliding motility auxiliary subunit